MFPSAVVTLDFATDSKGSKFVLVEFLRVKHALGHS